MSREIAEYIGMSVGSVHKWCERLAGQTDCRKKALRDGRPARYSWKDEIKEAYIEIDSHQGSPGR